ncbi:MAG: hypothetical protein IPK13_04480 [Deltaproteobacteria bacterium]|nr:hypothetical protein [Deltaproteobacteria bacterium]
MRLAWLGDVVIDGLSRSTVPPPNLGVTDRPEAFDATDTSLDEATSSDPSGRDFLTRSAFTGWERQAAGEDHLRRASELALLRLIRPLIPRVKTLADLKSRCAEIGQDYEMLRRSVENALLTEAAPRSIIAQRTAHAMTAHFMPKTAEMSANRANGSLAAVVQFLRQHGVSPEAQWIEREAEVLAPVRQAYVNLVGRALAKEAVAASILARCIHVGLIAPGVTLATELPPEIRRRVEHDPRRKDQNIDSYGRLLLSLEHGDGRINAPVGVDALLLARYIPGATQAKLLEALTTEIDPKLLDGMLRSAGFRSVLSHRASTADALTFEAPALFGLGGESEVERTQQQVFQRLSGLLVDENHNGRVDGNDLVYKVRSDGELEVDTYDASLSARDKETFAVGLATIEVAREYAAVPESRRIRWLDCDPATGAQANEQADLDLWTVIASEPDGDIWTLKPDVRPSRALEDALFRNGSKYETDCARSRLLIRLAGLHRALQHLHGREIGTALFDTLFIEAPTQKAEALTHIERFRNAHERDPTLTWDDFIAHDPPPIHPAFCLSLTRHEVHSASAHLYAALARPKTPGPGDSMYIMNPAASERSAREGHIGENVIDLGFRNKHREYLGHPYGRLDEHEWQRHVNAPGFSTTTMAELQEYVSRSFIAALTSEAAKKVAHGAHAKALTEIADARRLAQATTCTKVIEILAKEVRFEDAEPVFNALASHDHLRSKDVKRLLAHLSNLAVVQLAALFDTHVAHERSEPRTVEAKALAMLEAGLASNRKVLPEAHRALHLLRAFARLRPRMRLTEPGRMMASREAMLHWVARPDFARTFRRLTGHRPPPIRDPRRPSRAEIHALTQQVFPGAAEIPTHHAQANGGGDTLAGLMTDILTVGHPRPPSFLHIGL